MGSDLTIGIFGGGQLGRMLAMGARVMGYRSVSLDPGEDCPASQVTDHHIVAAYDDLGAARELAERSDVVTYEFENVDATAIEVISELKPVYPSPSVLRVCQDREIEKSTMRELGIGVPEFRVVRSGEEASEAVREIGVPVVMKTTRWGYDGKGQQVVRNASDAEAAFEELGGSEDAPVIVEGFVDFEMEVSVVCARSLDGKMRTFPVSENVHVGGILDTSIVPARCSDAVKDEAVRVAMRIAEGLDVIGLIAVEMFVTRAGEVLVNELAPRPHNSGHYTIEGCETSQFEQLARIMVEMPMGDVSLRSPTVMVNLLGDVWETAGGSPDWGAVLAMPRAHLHLYGKSGYRTGRKMGHITVTGETVEGALAVAIVAREAASRT
ncbi:MAG: 5-(carboxyamino)imidazole ribonucleotide synthase [Chloroflexi bacterium]|nr:5-(carboxyamino)imidazole ribonucleotide synthase [Chloroflexota bacterium]